MKGLVYREKRRRLYGVRYAGVVMDHTDALRIQTVQLIFGVWVKQMRSRVRTITRAEFAKRFEAVR